ncbi:ABC-type transport auxiliary lipoprotein family protein [Arboricoccus pini]|uniref:ABC-type transport auxiliary lipoprotein family protein n=1 Tax=Arboricoccus pini TaxID=1963835 RepID=UPI001056918B|nr:hypothetical protein [Arboricoccus pini]
MLGLTACGSLSPTRLWQRGYALQATPVLRGSIAPVGWNLLIIMPNAIPPLDGQAILSAEDGMPPSAMGDSKWRQSPTLMVRDGLRDAFLQSGAIQHVGIEGDGAPASLALQSNIAAFQLEEPSGEPPRVRVALDLVLIRSSDGKKLGFSSVAGQAKPDDLRPASVVKAFDEAAGNAFREAVNWTLRTGERQPVE